MNEWTNEQMTRKWVSKRITIKKTVSTNDNTVTTLHPIYWQFQMNSQFQLTEAFEVLLLWISEVARVLVPFDSQRTWSHLVVSSNSGQQTRFRKWERQRNEPNRSWVMAKVSWGKWNVFMWNGDIALWNGNVVTWNGNVVTWNGDVVTWTGDAVTWNGNVVT